MTWIRVHGILAQGYHVASGPSADYPYGALDRQRPIFKERGLDLGEYFNGTLNVDIRPQQFAMVKPEYTFEHVEWTDLHPPEHFSFSRCKVLYKEVEYDGWVYYPHPETKLRNFHNPSLLEVIAKEIPNIQYGDELDVLVNADEISVSENAGAQNTPLPEKKPGVRLTRNQLIAGIALLGALILLVAGVILFRFINNNQKPDSPQRSHIVPLGYCSSSDIKPCVVSFSLDAQNQMLVNILIPVNYADFYLQISSGTETNKYECQRLKDFPSNAYCTGQQMFPGATLHFVLISTATGQEFAKGDFPIIGVLLSTPMVEATETEVGTGTPEVTESSTPLFLEIFTPTPGTRVVTATPSSYPNPSYYP